MEYLIASLVILACAPLIASVVTRYQRASKVVTILLIAAISYNILTHIIVENLEAFGWTAALCAVAGAVIFGFGDEFFLHQARKSSRFFLVLVHIFLWFHAMIDGAALIGSELPALAADLHASHGQELSLSVLSHRLLFEVFIWKYFLDRYGRASAVAVMLNIALGTLVGFVAGKSLFQLIPSYFGLFEAFIGGALLHLVYDYFKERLRGTRLHFRGVAPSPSTKQPCLSKNLP